MGSKTEIGWTQGGATWNPLAGCGYISPGCRGCYAARDAFGRLRHLPTYEGLAEAHESGFPRFTGEVRLLPGRLQEPMRWRKPRFIFVNSMSDLFHEDVPDSYIADAFAVMAVARQHTYQILTKRAQRMANLLGDTDRWLDLLDEAMMRLNGEIFATVVPASQYPMRWVWLGVSIEDDAYSFRANHLRRTAAGLRFLSLEPLIGDLPSLNLDRIGWVIAGGESGPKSRPTDPEWLRGIRDRCADAGIPFFLKQMGQPWAHEHGIQGKGSHIEDFPKDLRIQQMPVR